MRIFEEFDVHKYDTFHDEDVEEWNKSMPSAIFNLSESQMAGAKGTIEHSEYLMRSLCLFHN